MKSYSENVRGNPALEGHLSQVLWTLL